nr:TOBE domain-containing protein [Sphaerochaetaceae bacterium]
FVRNPQVMLMDEPLSNLDAKLRNQMRAEIIKLRSRINTTFIYVTHDQTEAMTLGDRIVIMKDGYIQQVGTPQEVFNHPHNLFVAGFIGTPRMNLFDAVLREEKGVYYVELGVLKVKVSDEKQKALKAKGVKTQEITLGVRPEHMRVCAEGEEGVDAVIDVNEMMGSSIHLHVTSLSQDVVMVISTIEMSEKAVKELTTNGSKIKYTFPGKAVHLFDKETGINIEE